MNIYPIVPAEAFHWADKFTKASGLDIYSSLSILAECARIQDCSKLLNELLQIENERNEFIVEILGLEGLEELSQSSVDADEVPDEFFEEIYGFDLEYRCDYDNLEDDEVEETEDHFRKVLSHHNFSALFIDFFVDHLCPLSELSEEVPAFDSAKALDGDFDPSPFYDYDPQVEAEADGIESVLRMANKPHPAGWVAVLRKLGISIKKDSIANDWELLVPSMVLEENGEDYPVYLMPPARSPFDDEDPLCNDLKREIRRVCPSNAIIFWHGPISMTQGEFETQAITFWGEILIDGKWNELILREGSTSIAAIIKDALVLANGADDDAFGKLSSTDNSLIFEWSSNHISLLGELFAGHGERRH